MDIEERAERWAAENTACHSEHLVAVTAYLAGSSQTQRDYVAHYSGRCDCGCANCSGCTR